jgi:4-hydroxy-3-polyprenylbenzoate decarboxylase
MNMNKAEICLAVTGASGFQYGLKLLEQLLQHDCVVHLLLSDAAREVARLEADIILEQDLATLKAQLLALCGQDDAAGEDLKLYDKKDWLSPVASGSANIQAMVVCPCSTGTLASIANGQSNNLIERAATVTLKEQRKMILLTREMPLSAIQLEQMHKLALMGVSIMPASPGFYHKPKSVSDLIDFVVARILQQLNLNQQLIRPWGQ